jgi:O-antigen/teichoic acid export membrane protein
MDTEKAILKKSLVGLSYLASVQVISRLFTFLLNVALARYMDDPAALGVASVQLYLL